MQNIQPVDFLYLFVIFAGIAMLLSIVLVLYIVLQIRRLDVPETAGFLETLRITPLPVVILLDLLDFSLDIFSAPFSWAILSYLGLKQLRTVAVVKDLIPVTNFLPAMTIAWSVARMVRDKRLDYHI